MQNKYTETQEELPKKGDRLHSDFNHQTLDSANSQSAYINEDDYDLSDFKSHQVLELSEQNLRNNNDDVPANETENYDIGG